MADWVSLTLQYLGATETSTNRVALEEWAQSEGMPASAHNPLAASDHISGWQPTPGYSEPTYPSDDAAARLYATKFQSAQYVKIGFTLELGNDLNAIYDAINQSPWCSGCQGGHYPIVIYNTLHGTTTPVAPPRSTAPGGAAASLTASGHRGYADLRNSVSRHLPTQLLRSRQAGAATLRTLAARRKVGR